MRANELYGHTGLYNAAALNEGVDLDQPQARDDNYLIILGLMLLVETYQGVRNVLRTNFLVLIGQRSFGKSFRVIFDQDGKLTNVKLSFSCSR